MIPCKDLSLLEELCYTNSARTCNFWTSFFLWSLRYCKMKNSCVCGMHDESVGKKTILHFHPSTLWNLNVSHVLLVQGYTMALQEQGAWVGAELVTHSKTKSVCSWFWSCWNVIVSPFFVIKLIMLRWLFTVSLALPLSISLLFSENFWHQRQACGRDVHRLVIQRFVIIFFRIISSCLNLKLTKVDGSLLKSFVTSRLEGLITFVLLM